MWLTARRHGIGLWVLLTLSISQTYEVEEMVVIAVDILIQIADYNSSIVRDYILKHQSDSVDEVSSPLLPSPAGVTTPPLLASLSTGQSLLEHHYWITGGC